MSTQFVRNTEITTDYNWKEGFSSPCVVSHIFWCQKKILNLYKITFEINKKIIIFFFGLISASAFLKSFLLNSIMFDGLSSYTQGSI